MNSRLGVMWLPALAILAAACGDSSKTSVTAPSAARCEVAATAQPASLDAPGGAISIVVTTNRECAWEARSEADWLAAPSGASGQGDGTVQFAAAANALVTARQGAIIVNDRRVQITQGAAPCVFALDRPERAVGSAGGRHDVAVSAQAGCAWSAVSDAPWITMVAGATGQGPGVVSVVVSPNPALEARAGTVLIAGQLHRVDQAGATATPTPGCVFAVAPQSLTFEADGGNADVAVTASLPECPWSAASSDPWITLQPPSSGSGMGRLRFTVARHTGTTFRSGTITVAGAAISIVQAAAGQPAPTPCAFTVPTAIAAPADGGNGEVPVTASAAACQWTASSAAAWITIAGAPGGTGSGRLAYTVAPNTAAAPRSGTLMVAGTTVTITQGAAPTPPTPTPTPSCSFTATPTTASFAADGGPGSIGVTASASTCAWTAAATNLPWITITGAAGGTGSGQLAFTVAANTATAARSGTLTVAGTAVTINQAAAVPPPCAYVVSPSPVSVGFTGDNDIDLNVVTSAGCAWTAESQASWITINGTRSGTGNGRVRIAVEATLAVNGRTGRLLIGGQTVTVNQAGILNQEVTLEGTISGLSGACPNRRFTIAGSTIVTNGSTNYPGNDDCGDLRNGRSARVLGRGQADGSILATRIDRINGGDDDDDDDDGED